MRVKQGQPWFVFLIRRFVADPPDSAVFTVGKTVYSLHPDRLTADVLRHEGVHAKQQAGLFGALIWWVRFLLKPAFRLEQEVEAYHVQFTQTIVKDRNQRARWLLDLANILSGEMYGRIVTTSEARRLIESG